MENSYLKNFDASEIYKLFEHLKTFAKSDDPKDQEAFVLNHFKNFFCNLTIEQENELVELIRTPDNKKMQEFINKNPDIEINKQGTNKPKDIPGWKVKNDSLIYSYKLIKQKKNLNSMDKQIIKARELQCLKNIKPKKSFNNLLFELNKFQTKNNVIIQYIKDYKKKLEEYFDTDKFFSKLLTYYMMNTNYETFLKYVFYYLDIVLSDKEQNSELTKEYLETIKSIL